MGRRRPRKHHILRVSRPIRMPRLDRRRPDPPVRFHIHLDRSLIVDHHRATQDVRRGNSIADRRTIATHYLKLQMIPQTILQRSALLTAHAERKASLTPVGIHRDRPPMNAIAARRQRFEGNAYHVAIDLRLALINVHSARIRYVGGAKCSL